MANLADTTFKLTYFCGRGRSESIRYLFHLAKVPFEDDRVAMEDWPKVKPTTPLGQLPVLTISSGNQTKYVSQSSTILRQLANLFGFAGKNPEEVGRCDEASEVLRDVREQMMKAFYEEDKAAKEKLFSIFKSTTLPCNFIYLERQCVENGNKRLAGGEGFTYADLMLSCILEFLNGWRDFNYKDIMESTYPHLHAIHKDVEEVPEIKAYLAKRPFSPF